MQVKGSVVSSIQKYVREFHPKEYQQWFEKLSESSKKVFAGNILATEWYSIEAGVIEPTKLIGKMFFYGDQRKASWECGKYSAKIALTGIYKVFVLIATPQFIMKRAGKILASFYHPSTLVVGAERPKGVDIHITEFPNIDDVIEQRIGGWMETALEICRCKNINTKITRSMVKGDEKTVYEINWD